MGIFYDMVKISNLAPIELNVRFDGSDLVIPVGDSVIPKPAVIFAKNQNVIMGSQSPSNPSVSGAKYLVGVYGTKDRTTPLTEAEWATHLDNPHRMDIVALAGQRLGVKERFEVHGSGPVQAKSSWDEGVRVSVNTEFGAGE